MESGKADNSLNLAISLPEAERVSSAALSTGYDAATNRWELIVKYNGDLKKLAELLGFEAVLLINYYAIVTIAQEKIEEFLLQPEIEFAEKPNRLYFELEDSCEFRDFILLIRQRLFPRADPQIGKYHCNPRFYCRIFLTERTSVPAFRQQKTD